MKTKTPLEIMQRQALEMSEKHLIDTYIKVANNIIDGESNARNWNTFNAVSYAMREKGIRNEFGYLYHTMRNAVARN